MQAIINTLISLLNSIIPVLVALGVVYFVWGVVQYFIADAEEAKKTGKDRIIYGIIGLAVIVSVWGLVNIVIKTFGIGGASAPRVSSIGACTMGKTFAGVANYITCTINDFVIPFIFALAVVVFIWGIVKYFFIDADEEAKRTEGKQFIIWGLVALTVMVCVWGLVTILGRTFNINTSVIPQLKTK